MKLFVQATPAVKPKTKNIRVISSAAAGLLVIFAVAQLFTFEDYPGVVAMTWLPGGEFTAALFAAKIVVLEVAALPFLLAMCLSRAMRVVSMLAGWLVVAAWLVMLVWQNIAPGVVSNSGLLGATVSLPVGWWNVVLMSAFGVLIGWASWGMWPLEKRHIKS